MPLQTNKTAYQNASCWLDKLTLLAAASGGGVWGMQMQFHATAFAVITICRHCINLQIQHTIFVMSKMVQSDM